MREVMTKSMARNTFYGGSLFFILIFVDLTVHSHNYIVDKSTAAAPLTEEVAAGTFVRERHTCINCHTPLGESACGDRSVIDVEKEALTALAWGLDACGDEMAIRSFSSLRRTRVYVNEVKEFGDPMGPAVAARIAGLRPGFYTRVGAAIRHVAAELARRPRQRRLLLVITDGKPNDLDHCEGRHGL